LLPAAAEAAAKARADAEIAKARAEERIKAAAAEKAKVDAEVEARLQAHALNVAAVAEAQATKAITKAKEELPESAVTPVQPACVAIKTVVSSGVRGELNAALDRLDEVQLNRILSFVRSRYGAVIQEA
jgi:predicted 2-oxoglutarate/Fe(II)-dependent dioxygenase YbiX